MAEPFLHGRVLVATPLIDEPVFHHTVVLILAHGEEGAIGVVVNRPSDLDVLEVLPEWYGVTTEPSVVFVGGPVGEGAVICLGRTTDEAGSASWAQVFGAVAMVDLDGDPDVIQDDLREVRFFSGYAGWGSGQLEQELAEDAWVVADVSADDVFTTAPEQLWERVLHRQRGPAAWLTNFPADPSMN